MQLIIMPLNVLDIILKLDSWREQYSQGYVEDFYDLHYIGIFNCAQNKIRSNILRESIVSFLSQNNELHHFYDL